MKPNSYIPLYGDDFFRAVQGYPDHVAMGYLRAMWHNWAHEHCRGLRNEDTFLRRICQIDLVDWEDAKAVIFDSDKFFSLGEDGLWHQGRLSDEWEARLKLYESRSRGGKNRWKGRRSRK